MRLSGKHIIVTGAARGIGRACAVAFAREGADLTLIDIGANLSACPYELGSAAQLKTTADLCRDFGASAFECVADVRDPEKLRSCVTDAFDRYGSIDVLVNNAGIVAPSGKPVHEITETDWNIMIDVNLSGAWRSLSIVAPIMIRQRNGSIINIASTAGTVGYRHFAGYVAAKHGVVGLTKAAALDYATLGIRVNALCPGSVRDDPALEGRMLLEIATALSIPSVSFEQTFAEQQPNHRLAEAEDVAMAAVWLASDESRSVTGSIIVVDGGFTSR